MDRCRFDHRATLVIDVELFRTLSHANLLNLCAAPGH